MHDGRPHVNRPAALLAALPGFLETLARRGLSPAPLPGDDE